MNNTTVLIIYDPHNKTDVERVLIIHDHALARQWIGWCVDTKRGYIASRAEVVTDAPPEVATQKRLF